MKHLMILLMSLFLGLAGCNQEAVSFGQASSDLPGDLNTGDGEEPIVPNPDPDPDPDPDNLFKVVQDVEVDWGSKMTDILFVIDNSSSMRYEQTQISKRFPNFISQLDGVDWHVGITTTDARGRDWGDGRLHKFPNKDWFLTPQIGKEKAQKLFAKHVKREESGSDSEKGILTTRRAIERAVGNGSSGADRALRKFFRPDAALAVVVLSDEDESGNGEKSDGDNLIKYIRDSWGNNKVFQFNSIIVHTQKCLNGNGHTMGRKYQRLSKKTKGLVGDVCADNYSQMLTDLGQGVADLQRVYKLKCKPKDADNDGKIDLEVVPKNGSSIPGYTIDGKKLTFDKHLEVGDYEIHYFCED